MALDVQDKVKTGRAYEDADGSSASAYFDLDYNQGGYTITADRALAEIAARRAILSMSYFTDDPTYSAVDFWMEDDHRALTPQPAHQVLIAAVAQLASVYSDHPDYREEWKP